ncbi:MAG: hypothetical protein ACR2OW_15820 [Methyloligellaceae bacterium]
MRTVSIVVLVLILMGTFVNPSEAQQVCHFKTVPVKSASCDKGLFYVGPTNAVRFGGYCILPLNCKISVSSTKTNKCPGGSTYVGAQNASQVGGQCLSAPGWTVTARKVNSATACKNPEKYLGPSKPARLGGHCVKITK